MLRGLRAGAAGGGVEVGVSVYERIEHHLHTHGGYVAFSGGKDSLAALALTVRVDPKVPVVHFDSGLEYPETTAFVHDLARAWSLNLHVITARPTGLEVLRDSGAWRHHDPHPPSAEDAAGAGRVAGLFEAVIAEPAALAHERFGAGEVWGVRATESMGRACAYGVSLRRNTGLPAGTARSQIPADLVDRWGGVICRQDGTVALGPVWDWSTARVWAFLSGNEIPVNPVYRRLAALGVPVERARVSMMIDGGQLDLGRAVWLHRGWPREYARLVEHLPRLREFG